VTTYTIATKSRLRLALLSGLMALAFCPAGHSTTPPPASKPSLSNPRFPLNLKQSEIAHLLGWVPEKKGCAFCKGVYKEPAIVRDHPLLSPASTQNTHISSTGPTIFASNGVTILQRHVVVTQPGRMVTADKAYVHRNGVSGHITYVKLLGNVHMYEPGRVLISHEAIIDLNTKHASLTHAIYRVNEKTIPNNHNKKLQYDAFGTAKKVRRNDNKGITELWDANYSTCAPLHPSWQIHASYIKLDKPNEKGTARNVLLTFKNIPVLYTPYYSFPLSRKRKTGFLSPTVGHSSLRGWDIAWPFYWNMAPNYDMTFTPRYMTLRGTQLNDHFRYLTEDSKGSVVISGIPRDRGFIQFKNDTLNQNNIDPTKSIYLNALKDYTNARGYASWIDQTRFNNQWSLFLNANYVTDPYYFQDFGYNDNVISSNQLLNELSIQYNGTHWTGDGLVQAYQTLYNINQIDNPPIAQFQRLPELDLNGNYPSINNGLDWSVSTQFANFNFNSSYPPVMSYERPLGQRIHIRPTISKTFEWAAGYINPQVALDNTDYNAKMQVPSPGVTRQDTTLSRNLPIIDIDSGLYLSRQFHFDHHRYTQTLEPRFMYLYVPYLNQDRYPNFDAQALPMSYAQIFSLNRFTGYDRLENANQINLGLSSSIFSSANSNQKLTSDFGFIYYFSIPRVTIPGMIIDHTKTSPLYASINFTPNGIWNISGNATWQKNLQQTGINLNYKRDDKHVASIGYTYVRNIDDFNVDTWGFKNNTLFLTAGLTWPITHHWSTLSYLYYDFDHKRPQTYFGGLQYDTCCWALRFIVERVFTGVSANSTPTHIVNNYESNYYVQFVLKGLGAIDNKSPSSLLTGSISGYEDPFSNS